MLGFSQGARGIEEMMQRYQLSTQRISNFVDDILDHVLLEPSLFRKAFSLYKRRRIDGNFRIAYGEIHFQNPSIFKRDPIQLNIEKMIESAKDNGTILDIDSYPDRLDLKDEQIRKAVEIGAKLGISSDSHSKIHLHFLELGIAQARRGWATEKNIVNTREVEDFLRMLKSQ
jgi:hypothetical protein